MFINNIDWSDAELPFHEITGRDRSTKSQAVLTR